MLPFLILGEDAYITIHDFLDQNVVIIADLKNNGLLTSLNGTVPNMDGLNRSLFPYFTPFDIKMVCYTLLPTYWAIISYTFIYKIIAFLGMYLLLNKYIFKNKYKWVSFLLSIGFALVPFYMELALSGAGFPLVGYAFLNLYNNQNKICSYTIIIFYAFNSLLAYGGFFLLVILFCHIVYDKIYNNHFSKNIFYGALVMCFVYILANWGTIYSLFFSKSFISHRTEWIHSTTLISDIKDYFELLFFSQYHAGTCFAAPILFLYIICFIKYRTKYSLLTKVASLYIIIIIGILTGILLKNSNVQLFVTIQFDRFYFFYPSIVFIMLGTICHIIIKENHLKWAYLLITYGLVCGIYFDKEFKNNIKLLTHQEIKEPTFKQLYDVKLFTNIQKYLGINPDYKTKTVSVGLYPCIPEYNGFYTLDSYRVNYPLNYKNKFRTIISKELDKNKDIRMYFDNWGSRCYIFSSELGCNYLWGKSQKKSISHLDINISALKQLGCQYILSAVNIDNYKELNLKYKGSFTTENSFWDIKVYKL